MTMNVSIDWQYDEFQQVGKDYGNPSEVEVYDSSHADFRDIETEFNHAFSLLKLNGGDELIDFGCGTGDFAIMASRKGVRVHAVDVSEVMLDYAKKKIAEAKVENIKFHHAGFLTYHHQEQPADAIATTFAFHHLPDFWKGIALKRLSGMLKSGGRLYLRDVIMEEENALGNIAKLIKRQETLGGDFLRKDAEDHFREEFSTYDWVMDGLLERAGFRIHSKQFEGGVIGTYLCTKKKLI